MNFSQVEIAFILGRRSRPEGYSLEIILDRFQKEFASHDWHPHANKLLVIESVIERNKFNPEYAFLNDIFLYLDAVLKSLVC